MNRLQSQLRALNFKRFNSTKPLNKPGNQNSKRHVSKETLSLGYFTGNPHYYEALLRANEYIRQFCSGDFSTNRIDSSLSSRWLNEKEMEKVHSMKLEDGFHSKLINRLNILQTFLATAEHEHTKKDSAQALDESVLDLKQFLFRFYRPGAASKPAPRPKIRQVDGKIWARGSRKTARAQVWLAPGNGQVFINGLNIADMFPRESDRNTIVKPFTVSDTLGKYNVWAITSSVQQPSTLLKVTDSGEYKSIQKDIASTNALLQSKTAEAGAVSNAVARALAALEPETKPQLVLYNLLQSDLRHVERKKPGRPKARKKFTWVKR